MDMNVQELQRLNESITVCVEACRRLATHLQQVQQTMAQMSLPWAGQHAGIDPLTLLALQARNAAPWLGQFAQPYAPFTGFGQGFGGIGQGFGGIGQGGFGGVPFYGVPFGGQGQIGQQLGRV